MAQPNALLKKKAHGFVESIGKMSATERHGFPSSLYGEDYNKLVDMVGEANPNLVELLPPKVELYDVEYGGKAVSQKFSEVMTFCQQIVELL